MVGYPKFLYDNRFNDAVPVASSTAAGDFNVLNLGDWRSYTWWKPAALPATIRVNCGAGKDANAFAVYGHQLGSSGSTIECRKSTDAFVANDVLVATKTPADDKPFIVTFNLTNSQHWELKVSGGAPSPIAIAPIGVTLDMQRRLQIGFDPTKRTVIGDAILSEKGHPLGSYFDFEGWAQTLAFRKITWAWYRATFLPAWKAQLRGKPVLFAWDSVDHADELYLVQAGPELNSPTSTGEFLDLAFDVRGLALP